MKRKKVIKNIKAKIEEYHRLGEEHTFDRNGELNITAAHKATFTIMGLQYALIQLGEKVENYVDL